MKAGFTGTRNGMTERQKHEFQMLLATLAVAEFHHGDCVGADDEAASIFREFAMGKGVIIVHPPVEESRRAWNRFATETLPEKTHFARNRDIVDATDVLIGTPATMEHQSRGGTWYTIDYAKKRGKTVYVILPDGTMME